MLTIFGLRKKDRLLSLGFSHSFHTYTLGAREINSFELFEKEVNLLLPVPQSVILEITAHSKRGFSFEVPDFNIKIVSTDFETVVGKYLYLRDFPLPTPLKLSILQSLSEQKNGKING